MWVIAKESWWHGDCIQGGMTEKQSKTLHRLLTQAQREAVDKINADMPSDNVPDRIAIPILNRLERRQEECDKAFNTVFDLIQW